MGTINVTSGLYHRYDRITLSKGGSIVSMGDRPSRDMISQYAAENINLLGQDLISFNDFAGKREQRLIGENVLPLGVYLGANGGELPPLPGYVGTILGSGIAPTIPSGVAAKIAEQYPGEVTIPSGLPPEYGTPLDIPPTTLDCGKVSRCFYYLAKKTYRDIVVLSENAPPQVKRGSQAANQVMWDYIFNGIDNGNFSVIFPQGRATTTRPNLEKGEQAAASRGTLFCDSLFREIQYSINPNLTEAKKIKCLPCGGGTGGDDATPVACKKTLVWGGLHAFAPTNQQTGQQKIYNNCSISDAEIGQPTEASFTSAADRSKWYYVICTFTIHCYVRLFVYCDDSNC